VKDEPAITGALSFGALEKEFTRRISSVSPELMHGTWVLVPTNLLALHLRRVVASETRGLVGVKFLTLKDAAGDLARPTLARKGLRAVPEGAEELFVRNELRGLREGSYFCGLRDSLKAPLALLRAIKVLENSLWSAEKLRAAASEINSADPAAQRKLAELADIWGRLNRWKGEHGFFDTEELLRAALEAEPRPSQGAPQALFIYGFYDLTPLQQALVSRIARICGSFQAFLLWHQDESGPAPGFDYARPTVEFFMELLRSDEVFCADEAEPASDLDRVRRLLFAEHTFLDDKTAGARISEMANAFDGSVRIVSCPGEFPEALEVAREALRTFECSPNADSRGVGVLVRTPRGAAEHLKEAFERTGLGLYLREGLPLKGTVAGRILISLLGLASSEAARSDVVEFLSLAQIEWPEGLSATALDRLSRMAGVVRGRKQWSERLRALARSSGLKAHHAESAPERDAAGHDAELCQVAAGFLEEFLESVSRLAQSHSWPELAQRLAELLLRYVPGDAPGWEEVVELVRALAALEVSESRPEVSVAQWLLQHWLSAKSLRTGHFQRGAVAASSLMGSRGTTFDVVIVPGLCENGFPLNTRGDPVLTEPDREALNRLSERIGAGMLPLAARRPLEERYLFGIALGSARKRIVLCYARMEEGTARPRMPSRFLLNCCAALFGFGFNAELLESELPPTLFRRVRAGEAGPDEERRRLAVDMRERDLQVFIAAPQGVERIAYTREISPCFARAVLMEKLRWNSREFGPFDGKIRAGELVQTLRRDLARFAGHVSPSRFETYARCPFRFFLKYVLRIEELAEPAEEYALSPQERGRLIHNLLSRVYQRNLAGTCFKQISDADLKRILKDAEAMADEVAESYPEAMPASWLAGREDALECVRDALELDRSAHPNASPRYFEFEFGPEARVPALRYLVDADTEVSFVGRADRIDLLAEGGFQVIDYKTGTGEGYRKDSFMGGTQLQLPIYLLAAKRLTGARSGSARYFFVSEPKLLSEFTLEQLTAREDELRSLLKLILEGIRGGDFFLLPDEKDSRFCREHCEFRLVCGAGWQRVGQVKASDPAVANLAKLREID